MTAASPRYDVAIIGAGVVGCAVFRELALHSVRCVLLERGADILDGASKGNSAILHTGFDAPPGSLELRLMQAGRRRYLADRDQLGLPILHTNAVLVAWTQAELARLQPIRDRAHPAMAIDGGTGGAGGALVEAGTKVRDVIEPDTQAAQVQAARGYFRAAVQAVMTLAAHRPDGSDQP